MKRRIAALGAMLLAVIGIVVIAPEAPALNTEGIHTVHFDCVATGHNSTTDFTYSLTLNHVDPATNSNGAKYWYDFQLLSSTFHGTPPPGTPTRSPSLSIGPSGQTPAGEAWISAGFGGSQTTANHTWPNGAASDGVTLTDEISWDPQRLQTLNWTPRVISIRPNFEGNNRLRFSIYGIPGGCVQYLDLGFPDAPHELGNLSHQFSCGGFGDPTYIMNVDYSVVQVAGNTYQFHVESVQYIDGSVTPSDITMDISGIGRPAEVVDSGSANWTSPPGDFDEVDGVFGVTFPTVTWDYQPGQHPNVGIIFSSGSNTCDATIDLDYNWNNTFIGADPLVEDTAFDDCSGNTTVFKVKPSWQKTQDGKTYRLASVQIFQSNSSASKIVLDPGTATVLGGITVSESFEPRADLVTIGSGVSLADRTITSGEWQTFPVTDAAKWVRVTAPSSHSSAPASFYTPKDRFPMVTIRGKVFSSLGVQCNPANPNGPLDISRRDFQPIDWFL